MKYLHTIAGMLVVALTLFRATTALAEDLPPVREYTVNGVGLMVIEDARFAVRPEIFPAIAEDPAKLALLEGKSYPCYAFVIRMNGRTVLVDTGWGTEGGNKGRTVERLAEAGIRPEDIRDILITHMHIDHISGLVRDGRAVFPQARLHVSRPEHEYWVVRGADASPEYVALARQVASVYEGRIDTFDFGHAVLPGITAEGTPGHTPGHTAFTVEAGDSPITLVGDMIHAGPLQYPFPDVSPTYDVDQALSSKTRKEMLDRISARNGILAGAHIWEVGRVAKKTDGGYLVTPLQ